MKGFRLAPCSSSSSSSSAGDELARERDAVKQLEDQVVGDGFSMVDLEKCYKYAISPVTKIILGSLIERALNDDELDFEQIADMVSASAETDDICQKCLNVVCSTPVPLTEVLKWTDKDISTYSQAQIICRFSAILEDLRPSVENPCDIKLFKNQGFATWAELSSVAQRFMQTKSPKLSDSLEVIHFLEKQPYLNMTASTRPPTGPARVAEENDISAFDSKIERLQLRYPIIDTLTDPALVIIEPIGGGPPPPQVAAILAAMGTATVNPMTSLNLPDPAGPPGTTFGNIFQTSDIKEARTFAATLRVALADANGAGGPGPATRILVANSSAAAFRVF